jgi:hypothetical protein
MSTGLWTGGFGRLQWRSRFGSKGKQRGGEMGSWGGGKSAAFRGSVGVRRWRSIAATRPETQGGGVVRPEEVDKGGVGQLGQFGRVGWTLSGLGRQKRKRKRSLWWTGRNWFSGWKRIRKNMGYRNGFQILFKVFDLKQRVTFGNFLNLKIQNFVSMFIFKPKALNERIMKINRSKVLEIRNGIQIFKKLNFLGFRDIWIKMILELNSKFNWQTF